MKESYEWKASEFSRHESNRAHLGRSRKTSCWPPTTPQTPQELERALLEEWGRIPQLVIHPLSGYLPPEKLFRKRFTLILLFSSKMQQTSILSPF
ncbi:hypothetical protein TNCV_1979751 [Trichonephila clavipes]|nr:hypothetical protein TNCV_1979751 [Trichonephila clavipes]